MYSPDSVGWRQKLSGLRPVSSGSSITVLEREGFSVLGDPPGVFLPARRMALRRTWVWPQLPAVLSQEDKKMQE